MDARFDKPVKSIDVKFLHQAKKQSPMDVTFVKPDKFIEVKFAQYVKKSLPINVTLINLTNLLMSNLYTISKTCYQ